MPGGVTEEEWDNLRDSLAWLQITSRTAWLWELMEAVHMKIYRDTG